MWQVKSFGTIAAVFVLLLAAGCGGPLNPASHDDGAAAGEMSALSVTDVITLPDGTIYERGVLGPGALYEIHVPAGWDEGKLVLYSHGYVSPNEEPQIPDDIDDLLPFLLAEGFAVAYSSFSETGWAVKDGAIRTRQLLGHFKSGYGDPQHAFLVGASQGGLISTLLAEQNPNLFDGMLSLCAPIGGAATQMEHIIHVRVLFDHFWRDAVRALALSGADPDLAPAATLLDNALGERPLDADGTLLPSAEVILPLVGALVMADPSASAAAALMHVDGEPLFDWPQEMILNGAFVPELAVSITSALWFNLYGTADLMNRTNGHVPVDTSESVYFSPLLSSEENEDLNLAAPRLRRHPAGANYLRHWYQPRGTLQFPVIALHTTRDPAVPARHLHDFGTAVSTAGRDHFLLQREIEGFGHCEVLIPPHYQETDPAFQNTMLTAFSELVTWAVTGVRPD